MSNNKPSLSKGLDAILKLHKGDANPTSEIDARVLHVSLNDIIPSRYQPRKVFSEEALSELSQSIKSEGIIQPLIVRHYGESYEIIAGERRWRAAKIAGLNTVPAIVRDIDDATSLAFALIENIQRQDLNPIEEAEALQRLLIEFSITHEEVAKKVGRSRTAVSNLLRLLALEEMTKQFVHQGKLSMGHARALLALPPEQQPIIAKDIIQKELSVRQTEKLISQIQKNEKTPDVLMENIGIEDEAVERLAIGLSKKFFAKVDVKFNHQKQQGKIIIKFNGNVDKLEEILNSLSTEV